MEEVSEVQEIQGNKSWVDAMDEVEADHANEQESQRTSLITPQEDDVPVPDAIKSMIHNGANSLSYNAPPCGIQIAFFTASHQVITV